VKETLKLGAGRYLKKPLILEELGLALKEELPCNLPPVRIPGLPCQAR
jgi:hypothetical protein